MEVTRRNVVLKVGAEGREILPSLVWALHRLVLQGPLAPAPKKPDSNSRVAVYLKGKLHEYCIGMLSWTNPVR